MIPTHAPLRILRNEGLDILDQTALPLREDRLVLRDLASVCDAIRALRVRGAPLLGLCGAGGMAVAAHELGSSERALRDAAGALKATRPTAVDLGRAVDAALGAAMQAPEASRSEALWSFAEAMLGEQVACDEALASHGAPLLTGDVLTHCNTGALATGGLGTALAVIIEAHRRGSVGLCYATETRPLLQGARLTMWELARASVPGALLPDTAAASLVASGRVSAVITGADRIAANGDTANKIGTFGLALAAARAGIPFYIAAPMTTVDLDCPRGSAIPIEFRDATEVGGFAGVRWTVEGADAYNPAFDVTPADLVKAIITERGVARPPYTDSLPALAGS